MQWGRSIHFAKVRESSLHPSLIFNCPGIIYVCGQKHAHVEGLGAQSGIPARLEDSAEPTGRARVEPRTFAVREARVDKCQREKPLSHSRLLACEIS